MPKTRTIELSIPHPCREDWDKMTPTDKGRNCAHCQKRVIDFSKWTDTQLHHFFKDNEGPVCGRFHYSQLNRNIQLPPQPHSRLYKMVVALGLTLVVAGTSNALARPNPPLTGQVTSNETNAADSDSTGTAKKKIQLSGTLHNENGKPVGDADIMVRRNDKIVARTVSDSNGYFTIVIEKKWVASGTIIFDGPDYEYAQQKLAGLDMDTKLDIVLERRMMLGMVLPKPPRDIIKK